MQISTCSHFLSSRETVYTHHKPYVGSSRLTARGGARSLSSQRWALLAIYGSFALGVASGGNVLHLITGLAFPSSMSI